MRDDGGRRGACPVVFAPRFGVRYTRPPCDNDDFPAGKRCARALCVVPRRDVRGGARTRSSRVCKYVDARGQHRVLEPAAGEGLPQDLRAWAPTSRAAAHELDRQEHARRPPDFPRSTPRRSARATTCAARSSPTSCPQRRSCSPKRARVYDNGAPTPLPEEQSNAAKYQERIARLRQSVQLHERNIEALKKELAARR